MKLFKILPIIALYLLFSGVLAAEEKEDKPSLNGDPFAKKRKRKKNLLTL